MSHAPFSLFHHSVLICFTWFSVMIHCISKEASMRALQFCVLTTTESSAKIWHQSQGKGAYYVYMTLYGCSARITPFFSASRYTISPLFLEKVYDRPSFLSLIYELSHFLTSLFENTHIFAQIFSPETKNVKFYL